MVGVALYHVIHGIGARVCPLGNGLRIGIRIILVGTRIHHRAAGGGAYVHQVLGLPGIGQILGRRVLGQHRAGFLDGELHLRVIKGIVAALLCGDGYSCVADIFVAGDAHAVIAGRQHRVVIVRRDGHMGGFLGAVVVVGVNGRLNRAIRLQIVAGQRNRHIYLSGRDIALGGGGVTDGVLAVTVRFGRTAII